MQLRLDVLLTEKKLVRSRRVGRDLIKSGNVKVNGHVVKKQGKKFDDTVSLEVTDVPKYVSRAGNKLEAALSHFKISSKNKVALDVGASTGGFTDCLLQNGASKVYAIEVGTAQMSDEIQDDQRVVSMENTDIRNVKKLPEKPQLAVIDVSFISLTQVLNPTINLIDKNADLVALIKPQFEVKRTYRKKSGIVKDTERQKEAIEKVKNFAKELGLKVIDQMESPVKGSEGNQEYLIHLKIK